MDNEAYFADLREAQGFDDAMIAAEREEVARLVEPGRIWPENWTVAQVFELCTWDKTITAGLQKAKVFWLGIPTREVLAACIADRVPRKDWPGVVRLVRVMVQAALPHLNRSDD